MDADLSSDRDLMATRMAEDLIGPRSADEKLSSRPSDVYLTGIIWPPRTDMAGEDDDKLALGASAGIDDGDESEASAVPPSSIQKPSVAGVSFSAVADSQPEVQIDVCFARYRLLSGESKAENRWERVPVEIIILSKALEIGSHTIPLGEFSPSAEGVILFYRCIEGPGRFLVTASLINGVDPGEGRDNMEEATLFQTSLKVAPLAGTLLVPRPTRRAFVDPDEHGDEKSGALLFRHAFAFAAGHTCSAEWESANDPENPTASWVATSWLPSIIVPGVKSDGHQLFGNLTSEGSDIDPLDAYALATATPDKLQRALQRLCDCYEAWINIQTSGKAAGLSGDEAATAAENLKTCSDILKRLHESAQAISKDRCLFQAFQLANFAMHVQHGWDKSKAARGSLRWRPFQLAFLLLSLPSAANRTHADREVMDLLWFPTGGGKTEAYLGLVAGVAFYRRLANPGEGDGVAALMRYTLRLLTTQQFARSAAMILACEAIRSGRIKAPHAELLAVAPIFSIGLWVGGDASPNKLATAWASLNGSREVSSPKQLAHCPACGSKVLWSQGSVSSPVIAKCGNEDCIIRGDLPVWTVDQDVYREKPTLLIGTIDKFAQIVRQKETNALFGIGRATVPDLIIQDELHLISGPLGTVAGTYEAAFDIMFSAGSTRPKIIGSTATIRRAAEQISDLFDRKACQFPPPAVDHDDSGFAVLDPKAKGRRYIGVSTAGRSAKFTLQAVSASLLQSAFKAFDEREDADPYWTLIGYFNSLRELGGALVLMQDDVTDSIKLYAGARDEEIRPMSQVEELTSRRTQEEVLKMLDQLAIRIGQPGALDAVLATNMVSVGVDIPRLGLMVVNGQPKTIAEYIQSTSRVGRGDISGLVVAILNNAKARDRSHFETFAAWHRTLYRDVEATSVTPFASRARDRSLHAALVAAVRHLAPGMLDRPTFNDAARERAVELIDQIAKRAERIDSEETEVKAEMERRLDKWAARSPTYYWMDYKDTQSLLQSAERAAWKKALGRQPGAAWPTLNSMRTVEAGTPFRMAPVLKSKNGE